MANAMKKASKNPADPLYHLINLFIITVSYQIRFLFVICDTLDDKMYCFIRRK